MQAMILKDDETLYIASRFGRFVPGAVSNYAAYYDMSADGMQGGDLVEVEISQDTCRMTLEDGSERMWFAEGPVREAHLLPGHPKAFTGGLPIAPGPKVERLLSTSRQPRLLDPTADLLDLEGLRALARAQVPHGYQDEHHFADSILLRVTEDMSNGMGPMFFAGEFTISRPGDLDTSPNALRHVWCFFQGTSVEVPTRALEVVQDLSFAPTMR